MCFGQNNGFFFLLQIKIVSVYPKVVKLRETKQPALAICIPANNILTWVYTKKER